MHYRLRSAARRVSRASPLSSRAPNHLRLSMNQVPATSKSLLQVPKALFWKEILRGLWLSQWEESWQEEDRVGAGPVKQVQGQ